MVLIYIENEHKKKSDIEKYIKMSMGVALKHFEIGCRYDNIEIEYRKFDVKKKTKNHIL